MGEVELGLLIEKLAKQSQRERNRRHNLRQRRKGEAAAGVRRARSFQRPPIEPFVEGKVPLWRHALRAYMGDEYRAKLALPPHVGADVSKYVVEPYLIDIPAQKIQSLIVRLARLAKR